MNLDEVFPRTVFHILGVPVRDTVVQAFLVALVLGVLCMVASRRFRVWEPRDWQLAVEMLVEYVEGQIQNVSGRALPQLVPLLTSILLFLGVSNNLGLFPLLRAPTRDLNTTAAMALVSLGSWVYFGIRELGVGGYLRSFVHPSPVMLPLNLLGMMSRVLSMTLRLFGNVMASEIVGEVMFSLVPALAPLPLTMLGMVTSILQAMVFTILTLVFIVDAMGTEETEAVGSIA